MSQEYEKRRADKEFVTRGEFEREHRFVWWGFVLMFIGIVLSMLLTVATCRADTTKVWQAIDSTFTPIEPQSAPAWACRLMCPSCGHCVPIKIPDDQLCCPEYFGITFMCRSGKAEGWSNVFEIAPGCKDILWGHWAGTFVDRHLWPDSIFIPVVRARGLDSTFNLQEKVWYYYDWLNGKRVNMRRSK